MGKQEIVVTDRSGNSQAYNLYDAGCVERKYTGALGMGTEKVGNGESPGDQVDLAVRDSGGNSNVSEIRRRG